MTVEVQLAEDDKMPEQHLDEGEDIERIVVPLSSLYDKLKGESHRPVLSRPSDSLRNVKRARKNSRCSVSHELHAGYTLTTGRLFHWALGLHWATRL